jgi:glycosyltransferase involved in cell wall biosynthesis
MNRTEFKTLSILIPVYNEGPTVHLILDKVTAVELPSGIQKEIILINDCSTDDTEAAIARYQAAHPTQLLQYVAHSINKGKGAAIHTGIALATGQYTLIQDADLEYDPNEYIVLLKPVLDGFADVGRIGGAGVEPDHEIGPCRGRSGRVDNLPLHRDTEAVRGQRKDVGGARH